VAINTFKSDPKPEKKKSASVTSGFSIFKLIEKKLKMDAVFKEGVPVEYFPYILYVSMIAIFYIANSHYADKTVRDIAKTKTEVEDLRADYTTLKSDYMFASKQSEVAKNVEPMGLFESAEPPYTIEIKEDEIELPTGE
jgi:hypothetical protein